MSVQYEYLMKTLPLSIIVILFVVGTGNAFAQSNNTSIYSSLIPDDHLIFPSTTPSNLNAESEKAIKEFVEYCKSMHITIVNPNLFGSIFYRAIPSNLVTGLAS